MNHTIEIKKYGFIFAVYINDVFVVDFEQRTEAVIFCHNIIQAVNGVKFKDT